MKICMWLVDENYFLETTKSNIFNIFKHHSYFIYLKKKFN